jgi:hypothetical protein
MKLIEKLEQFVKGNERIGIIPTTIGEIREVFKEKEEAGKVTKLIYYIFNSIWNRTPNFSVNSVLKDKLEYAIKIGIGIASYNQMPISWIEDKVFSFKNFLMKDRGHITTLVCWLYNSKVPVSIVTKIVDGLLKKYKSIDGWKEDYSLSHSIEILIEVKSYLSDEAKRQKKAGIKKADQTVSIQSICENVLNFNNTLNKSAVSIEVRKESIFVHMLEILGINNNSNKWIEYQKAFLSFVGKIMRIDGNDLFLRNKFNIEGLRTEIDKLQTFVGNTTILLFSGAVKSYKSKLSEYSEIIPIRFLGLRRLASYDKRGPLYYTSLESEIEAQLLAIHQSGLRYSDALAELKLIDTISKHEKWSSYEEKRKEILDSLNETTDAKNLEDAGIGKEDFAMACVDTVIELLNNIPGMEDRHNQNQINTIVVKFVDKLCERIEEVSDDSDADDPSPLFSAGKDMDNRFSVIIKPVYDSIIAESANGNGVTIDKDQIVETLLSPIKVLCEAHGQYMFDVVKLTKESYKKPEIVKINFNTKPNARDAANLDLGRKNQDGGYTLENCIIQQKHHNRSVSDGDHNITNIGYWEWFSETNLEIVKQNANKLFANNFKIQSDAQTLYDIFHK